MSPRYHLFCVAPPRQLWKTLVKAHRGSAYHRDHPASSRGFQVSRSSARDSGGVVKPLPETTINGRQLSYLRTVSYTAVACHYFNKNARKTSSILFYGAGQVVRLNTSFYNLAKSCAFTKQSPLPI